MQTQLHRRAFLQSAAALMVAPTAAFAGTVRAIDTQFIAALAGPDETSGTNAQDWGIWVEDPGPRGVWLSLYPALAASGFAPAGWAYDPKEFWLEEHGLIMEKPSFPLAPRQYVVSGGRETSAILTVSPPDASGASAWSLSDGVKIGQVTHLACRAAAYTPASADATCSPALARTYDFPLGRGATMPPVEGCNRREYAVLFVMGLVEP